MTVPNVPKVPAVPDVEEKKARKRRVQRPSRGDAAAKDGYHHEVPGEEHEVRN
jgi:hypothetical protein